MSTVVFDKADSVVCFLVATTSLWFQHGFMPLPLILRWAWFVLASVFFCWPHPYKMVVSILCLQICTLANVTFFVLVQIEVHMLPQASKNAGEQSV